AVVAAATHAKAGRMVAEDPSAGRALAIADDSVAQRARVFAVNTFGVRDGRRAIHAGLAGAFHTHVTAFTPDGGAVGCLADDTIQAGGGGLTPHAVRPRALDPGAARTRRLATNPWPGASIAPEHAGITAEVLAPHTRVIIAGG